MQFTENDAMCACHIIIFAAETRRAKDIAPIARVTLQESTIYTITGSGLNSIHLDKGVLYDRLRA